MTSNWYKDSIIYGIDVKLYQDSDDNGFGDFKGLTSRLDYLHELGINTIWLMPFFSSPLRDYGYDVADFFGIDQRLGNTDDFLNFIEACEKKRIRVIIDLVINHTSIEHPWFIQAKTDRKSPYRDYYIWRDERPENEQKQVMFEGVEDSVWAYVPQTKSFYLHSYYMEQADLNIVNPKVKQEIFKIIKYWLNLGVSGFRIDAAHALTEVYADSDTELDNLYHFLNEIREYTNKIDPDAILLAEADVLPGDVSNYFGEGDRMHMLFNFFSNQYTFLALARKSGAALEKGLELTKGIHCKHHLNFIRHHDELNINQLTKAEQKEVLEAFAPEDKMRVYNEGGIKRQLAPMMKGDLQKIKLTYVSIFSLPGSPLIHFGEEIGMGEDLERNLRAAVRIPMQWDDSIHGGFSNAALEKINHAPLSEGDYSYQHVNVAKQKKDTDSILNFFTNLIKIRKACPEIGHGEYEILSLGNDKLLAIYYKWEASRLLVICNYSSTKEKGSLEKHFEDENFLDILSDSEYKKPTKNVDINAYGYRWIKVVDHHKII
jgi:maltose alpha-D-glucosyltransferase / alpha-amylase